MRNRFVPVWLEEETFRDHVEVGPLDEANWRQFALAIPEELPRALEGTFVAFRWRLQARRARRVGHELASLPLLLVEPPGPARGAGGDQPDRHLAPAGVAIGERRRRFCGPLLDHVRSSPTGGHAQSGRDAGSGAQAPGRPVIIRVRHIDRRARRPRGLVLAVAGALAFAHPASAAGCPTATYLDYNHLAYADVTVPATVTLPTGTAAGTGTIDKPTSSNGCKRGLQSVHVLSVGQLAPGVAVLASGVPRTIFVIGSRCAGFAGSSYWDCLLRPLVFDGRQFTATSYPTGPAPRRTVALGAAIGTAQYQGKRVTVRSIDGVDPSLAVGLTGQPSDAFLSPSTCPYGAFSNDPGTTTSCVACTARCGSRSIPRAARPAAPSSPAVTGR